MSADRRTEWQQQLRKYRGQPQRRQVAALLALADLLDRQTGKGSASVADVAKAADVGERTVKRATAWAQTAGWLRRDARGHHLGDGTDTGNGWELLTPESQRAKPEPQRANSEAQRAKPSTPASRPASQRPAPRRGASKSQGRRCSNNFLIGLVDGRRTCCPQHDNARGRGACKVCGEPLFEADQLAGSTTHAECEPTEGENR